MVRAKVIRCLIALWLLHGLGCGPAGTILPGGGGSGTGAGSDAGQPADPGGGVEDTDPPQQGLTARIAGLPADSVAVGAVIDLRAEVLHASGPVQLDWSLQPATAGVLSDARALDPQLTLTAAAQLQVRVVVTDLGNGGQAEASAILSVVGSPTAPPEAVLTAEQVAPVSSNGVPVTLIARLSGPQPVAVVWTPDPDNPLPPDLLFFEDRDPTDNWATFVTSPLLNITYQLEFVVTATYANNGSLSDSVIVTVVPGP